MAKFKNNKTGNILVVNDEGTIALMKKSDRYTEVKDKKAKASTKNTENDTDTAADNAE